MRSSFGAEATPHRTDPNCRTQKEGTLQVSRPSISSSTPRSPRSIVFAVQQSWATTDFSGRFATRLSSITYSVFCSRSQPAMLQRLGILLLCWIAGLSGCGPALPPSPPSTEATPKVGPHGGTSFLLPEGAGYVEVVNEPLPDSRGRDVATAIVTYFLAADLKSASSVTPSDVKVIDKSSRVSVSFKLDARTSDPTVANRFATVVGPYSLTELRGQLSGTVAGKPFSFDLTGVR